MAILCDFRRQLVVGGLCSDPRSSVRNVCWKAISAVHVSLTSKLCLIQSCEGLRPSAQNFERRIESIRSTVYRKINTVWRGSMHSHKCPIITSWCSFPRSLQILRLSRRTSWHLASWKRSVSVSPLMMVAICVPIDNGPSLVAIPCGSAC